MLPTLAKEKIPVNREDRNETLKSEDNGVILKDQKETLHFSCLPILRGTLYTTGYTKIIPFESKDAQ